MPAPLPENHICIRCGSDGPFLDDAKLKCIQCDTATTAERKVYMKEYHRARSSATKKLIVKHEEEFDALLLAERVKIRKERAKSRA